MTEEDFTRIGDLINKSQQTILEVMDQRLAKSQQSLLEEVDKRLESRISQSEQIVMAETGEWMENNLFPRLERIERKIDYLAVQVGDHDQSLRAIKALPIIASALS